MAYCAGLPAKRVHLELLILRAGPAILNKSCSMPRLRLDLGRRLVFLGRVFPGNRFRNTLEVLFAEFELRHPPRPDSEWAS
jgi:hypothetical protein